MVLFFRAMSQRGIAAERGVHLSLPLSRHGEGVRVPWSGPFWGVCLLLLCSWRVSSSHQVIPRSCPGALTSHPQINRVLRVLRGCLRTTSLGRKELCSCKILIIGFLDLIMPS